MKKIAIPIKKIINKNILIGLIVGLAVGFISNYVWNQYSDYKLYNSALIEDLYFRKEFKSDDLKQVELKTDKLTNNKYLTRIVFVQNWNYFDNVFWFSLAKDSQDFPNAYSGILFYEFDLLTKKYEIVYEFTPLDIREENFLPGAKEQGIDRAPLLLERASIGDIDGDGKNELVTEWSYCNFNHCVWRYPIVIGYDGGYYIKWTMPKHELTEHDISGDYWWGGQSYERELINLYDNRKYKINGGNFIEYKYLNDSQSPYIISYNIDDESCWACEHTYLLDIFRADKSIGAAYTYHKSKGLEENFTKIDDYKFLENFNLLE